jgi:nitrite reductase/ring-hydroxylating ferredoxin subunit
MVVLHPHVDFDQVIVRHPSGFDVILVKVGDSVLGYRNICPHLGIGLDWGDGRCMTGPNELMCFMHGAVFTADTGYCTSGPCAGKSLRRVAVRVQGGQVVCA